LAISPDVTVKQDELRLFDSENMPIPSCTAHDWRIAQSILSRPWMGRLGEYATAFQGEVNETTDGGRGLLSVSPADGPMVLRGANICLYATRAASQGDDMFIREAKYLDTKKDSTKASHHLEPRVGWQESSPQNNFRRIIAAPISADSFCNHKINYIPRSASSLSLDVVLVLLNSTLLDWFFRLVSSSAAVSHYQVMNLPVPRQCDPGLTASVIGELSQFSLQMQKEEAARLLSSRSERSHLGEKSTEIQDGVDDRIFGLYGLSRDEAEYVKIRRREMM
jgi:hypothetical protein